MNSQSKYVQVLILTVTMGAVGWGGCATGTKTTSDEEQASTASTGSGGSGGSQQTTDPSVGGTSTLPCGIDCSEIETDACHESTCNLQTGSCAIVAAPDGTSCQDGLFCTINDHCSDGQCVGGPPNDCELAAPECHQILCHETKQSCSTEAVDDGATCTSDDLCVVNASCLAGACLGSPMDCTFTPVPDDCHVAECNPNSGNCDVVIGNEGLPCTDLADQCVIGKSCQGGICVGGYLRNCSFMTMACFNGMCDSNTGDCTSVAIADGDPCDDADPCTSGETCQASVCAGGLENTNCIPNDQCCPVGCNAGNDNDCSLTILLMGDDLTHPVFWDFYRASLIAAGVGWTERDLDSEPFPDAATLAPYNVLIWFDEYGASVDDVQALVLADWLALGGNNLFLTGIDLLSDLAKATPGLGKHQLYTMLGTTYLGESSGLSISSLDCVVGDPLTGDFVSSPGIFLSSQWFSSGDYAQETTGPAIHAALYASGGAGSGHSALSYHDAGGYRVVWLGVAFHGGLYWPTQRNTLLANILDFFKQ